MSNSVAGLRVDKAYRTEKLARRGKSRLDDGTGRTLCVSSWRPLLGKSSVNRALSGAPTVPLQKSQRPNARRENK